MASQPGYNDAVFINCPFDVAYMPILHAIVYTIYRCGFFPRTALNEDDASDYRLDKIVRYIQSCKYGVHDISRIETSDKGFPRFNMPFELGIFFGAKRFGERVHKSKTALVFEKVRFSYQQYISDLNGIDTKAHENDPNIVIRELRDWLRTASKRKTIPGHAIIQREYVEFQANLPAIVELAGLDIKNILFNDFCTIVEEAVKKKLA